MTLTKVHQLPRADQTCDQDADSALVSMSFRINPEPQAHSNTSSTDTNCQSPSSRDAGQTHPQSSSSPQSRWMGLKLLCSQLYSLISNSEQCLNGPDIVQGGVVPIIVQLYNVRIKKVTWFNAFSTNSLKNSFI